MAHPLLLCVHLRQHDATPTRVIDAMSTFLTSVLLDHGQATETRSTERTPCSGLCDSAPVGATHFQLFTFHFATCLESVLHARTA